MVDLTLLLGAAVWSVATSVLDHPLVGQGEFAIFFIPTFPVVGYSLVTTRGEPGLIGPAFKAGLRPSHEHASRRSIIRNSPVVSVGVLAALTVLAASVATGTLFPPNGQPEYDSTQDQYVLGNHGSLSVITKSAYEHLSVAVGHYSTVGACIFLITVLPIHLGQWRRWRTATTDPSDPGTAQ